nr:hypothetical protein [Paracoccus saliphilus]
MFVVAYLIALVSAAAAVTVSGLLSGLGGGTILLRVMLLVGGAQVLVLAVVAGLVVLQNWRGFGPSNRRSRTSASNICRWEPDGIGGGSFGRRHRHR